MFPITGLAFVVVVPGLDPLPRPMMLEIHIRMLVAAVLLCAALAVLLVAGPTLGLGWYEVVSLPWGPDRESDQRLGALLGAGRSEIVLLAALGTLLTWARAARRRLAVR